MTAAGTFMADFAFRGNLDSFAQTLMGFMFRHLFSPFKILNLKDPENTKGGV